MKRTTATFGLSALDGSESDSSDSRPVRNTLLSASNIASNLYSSTKSSSPSIVQIGIERIETIARPAVQYISPRIQQYGLPLVNRLDAYAIGHQRDTHEGVDRDIGPPLDRPARATSKSASNIDNGGLRQRDSISEDDNQQERQQQQQLQPLNMKTSDELSGSHGLADNDSDTGSTSSDNGGRPAPSRPWDGTGYTPKRSSASNDATVPSLILAGGQQESATQAFPSNVANFRQRAPSASASSDEENGDEECYAEDPGSSFLWHRLKQFLSSSRWFTNVSEILTANPWVQHQLEHMKGSKRLAPNNAEDTALDSAEVFFHFAQQIFYKSFDGTIRPMDEFVASVRHAMGGWRHWDHRLTRPVYAFYMAARAVSSAVSSRAGSVVGGAYQMQAGMRNRYDAGRRKGRELALACGDMLTRWDEVWPVARSALDKWLPLDKRSEKEGADASDEEEGQGPEEGVDFINIAARVAPLEDLSNASGSPVRVFAFSQQSGDEGLTSARNFRTGVQSARVSSADAFFSPEIDEEEVEADWPLLAAVSASVESTTLRTRREEGFSPQFVASRNSQTPEQDESTPAAALGSSVRPVTRDASGLFKMDSDDEA